MVTPSNLPGRSAGKGRARTEQATMTPAETPASSLFIGILPMVRRSPATATRLITMSASFIYKQHIHGRVKREICFPTSMRLAYMKDSIHWGDGRWTTDEDDRYRAPALDKGLDILELLAGVDGGLTQAEIAKQLDRSPNEFYRMLDRLVRRGYVTRLDGDRYSLTLKLFGLAQLHAPVRRLVSYATPLMRELAETSQQANQLVVFDRGSAVVIAQQEAPDYWGISIRVGSHISLFDTGSGHVLLAFRSQEERADDDRRTRAQHRRDGRSRRSSSRGSTRSATAATR